MFPPRTPPPPHPKKSTHSTPDVAGLLHARLIVPNFVCDRKPNPVKTRLPRRGISVAAGGPFSSRPPPCQNPPPTVFPPPPSPLPPSFPQVRRRRHHHHLPLLSRPSCHGRRSAPRPGDSRAVTAGCPKIAHSQPACGRFALHDRKLAVARSPRSALPVPFYSAITRF